MDAAQTDSPPRQQRTDQSFLPCRLDVAKLPCRLDVAKLPREHPAVLEPDNLPTGAQARGIL
jgi:hypothetical protein